MREFRARDLGLPLLGKTGKNNAITDVDGVEVGYSTIVIGVTEGHSNSKEKPIFARTGVTAILPRGKKRSAVFCGRYNLNGNGELTGAHWMDDSGFIHGPIMITNTNSVGIVRDSVAKWMIANNFYYPLIHNGKEIDGHGYFFPVVGETWDGFLNDINGFHVKEHHVYEALDSARSGKIEEGNVGGGTGMVCHGFKGGVGTSSRKVELDHIGKSCVLGVIVQANHGVRDLFMIAGKSIGKNIRDCDPVNNALLPKAGTGSIIVVIGTDAPVSPIQLSKMCRRVPIGLGRLGSGFENGSGDIFLAFSTGNAEAFSHTCATVEFISDDMMDPLYKAVADSVEESVLNALCAAETMRGKDGNTYYAMPYDQIKNLMRL